MKYAILGPKKAIFRISKTAPTDLGEETSFAEVSDEIAALVKTGQNPATRQQYFLIDGVLRTREEHNKILFPPPPRKQTKLEIMKRLEAFGKWTTFKYILGTMPVLVQDAWNLAQFIDESDPMFLANKPALLGALGLTEEQFGSLFDE